MSPVNIPCPKCSANLKLPNRQLLGRKGKCPKCQHRFILEEPDEVELQLADDFPASAPSPASPPVGTAAKWVPDDPAESPVPVLPAAVPGVPANTASMPQEASPVDAFNFTEPSADGTPNELEIAAPQQATVTAATRVRKGRAGRKGRGKRRGKTGPIVFGIGTALFAFIMIVILWERSKQSETQEVTKAAPQKNEDWEQEKIKLAESNESAKSLSPTSGEQIPMKYMPFTPHLVFHLRPAEIWGPNRQNKIFVATLSELGIWLSKKIEDITHFNVQEIEELTFAVNFGPRTSPPDIAAVVRLKSDQSKFDMQTVRLAGSTKRVDLSGDVFEKDQFSYMIIDPKTMAIAPVTLSDMLADSMTYSQQPPVELEGLLRESDRTRMMTLAFDVMNIDTHREYIFPETMQDFADEFVLWFGKDVQTISWSLHLGQDMFMETLLHENNESSPLRVQRHMNLRMQELPEMMVNLVRFMKPGVQGYREMIGRFPAMLKATTLGTRTHVGAGYVRMVTLLPAKAAANLAAASLFTWNESIVTDFSGPAPTIASGPALPDKVADRLRQIQILVDFRRTPLQEVFAYIEDEIKTKIVIDGDSLKLAAMTNNMPQTYNLGEVSALKAIDTIVTNPDYKGALVIVVDEGTKTITVTSRVAAENKGLSIYNTTP